MNQCQACQREFKEGVRFCPFDGQPLESAKVEEAPKLAESPKPIEESPRKVSLIGKVLDGKFRLEAKLRQEPLAATFGATQLGVGKPVTIKLIQLDSEDSGFEDSLRKQARQLAAIRHPNIVEILEIGKTEEPRTVYVVTEFVEAVSLKTRLSKVGPLEEREAASVLRQICAATQAVNAVGLFSAGLSSDNIWLNYGNGQTPEVKVDFAWLSEPLTPETKARIQRGEISCNPVYLSPEECRGEDPDGRSEVYRLGLIAYEMLAAKPPFESDSLARLILMQLNEAPPPIETVAPDNGVPRVLEPAVMRALAKLAQYRHQSAADFGEAIEEAESPKPEPEEKIEPAAKPDLIPSAEVAPPQEFASEIEVAESRQFAPAVSGEMFLDQVESFVFDAPPTTQTEAPPPQDIPESELVTEPVSPLAVVDASEAVTASVAIVESAEPAPEFVFVDPSGSRTGERPANGGHPAANQKPLESRPFFLDDNAHFTLFSPKVVQPLAWFKVLSFAHIAGLDEISRQADLKLREEIDQYQTVAQRAVRLASREDEITLVPVLPGVEFNPPNATFLWQEGIHAEDFLVRATAKVDGQTTRGRISVYLGSILIAEIPLSIRVDNRYSSSSGPTPYERTSAERFKKIFASYSQSDSTISAQFLRVAETFGEKYLRDVCNLRGSGVWGARLEKLILEADVFQLFWSTNAMSSVLMKNEWEYALSLRRPGFVRPTYWEDPLPSSIQHHLPPEELTRLGFERIGAGADTSVISTNQTSSMTGTLGSGGLSNESNPSIPVVDHSPNSEFEFNQTPPRAPEPVWTPPEHRHEPVHREPAPHKPVVMSSDSHPSSVAAQPAPATQIPPTTPQPKVSPPPPVPVSEVPTTAITPVVQNLPPQYYQGNVPYQQAMPQVIPPTSKGGSASLVLKILVFVLLACLLLLVGVYVLTRYLHS